MGSKAEFNEVWTFLLSALAAHSFSVSWKFKHSISVDTITVDELALVKWLCIIEPSLITMFASDHIERDVDKALLDRCINQLTSGQDASRASLLYFSLSKIIPQVIQSRLEENWQVGLSTKDAVKLIEIICRRFPLAVRQLKARHDNRPTLEITDEYDVQDLLHAMLQLHFDDIRAEEVVPSHAAVSSRIDFFLKQEKITIEVKMTRRGLGQKELMRQLIVDKEQYREHPDYRTLICFIYDPDNHCQNPVALENDLAEEDRGYRVIVIIAPRGT
jgi:hypothetical protein